MSVNPESRLDDTLSREVDWRGHVVRAGTHRWCKADSPDPKEHREHVEPWLSALFQAEHLNVLVGSGLTTAIACAANAPAIDMSATQFGCSQSEAVEQAAQKSAESVDRESPNIEDQLRTVIELIGGLRILASNSDGDRGNDAIRQAATDLLQQWKRVNRVLRDMLSIPSSHLVIISFDDADGRLPGFYHGAGNEAQMTLLVGRHFGDLKTLVDHYLPKPAIDRTTWRMVDLLNRRTRPGADGGKRHSGESPDSEGSG